MEASRDGESKGGPSSPPRKRFKSSLTCENCRRRKVKDCDNVKPICGNCSKKPGLRSTCYYSTDKTIAKPIAAAPSPPSPAIPPAADPVETGSTFAMVEEGESTRECSSGSRAISSTRADLSRPTTREVDYVLPSRRQSDRLVEVYWKYVDPLYPFLDKDAFESSYQGVFNGTPLQVDERVFVATLNVILALTTQLNEKMSTEEREQTCKTFFDRAQNLLQLNVGDTGSIELVQYLLLLSQYLQSLNDLHTAWMVVGTASRIAQGLGLHLRETSMKLADPKARELYGRLWHGCILMDRCRQATILRTRFLHARMLLLRPMLAMFCQFQSPGGSLSSHTVPKLRPDIFSPSSISKPWNEAKSIIRYNTRYGVSARRCEAALQILCSKLSRNPNESGNPSDSIVMDHADVDNFNFDADHCQWISSLPGEIVY
ncbi:fungal-specific transcription factor domain-containing protein [Hypoxylon fuscum]|nr:fungal-specific transcription factor domain-containing protein [Hypoxylon fuscum]